MIDIISVFDTLQQAMEVAQLLTSNNSITDCVIFERQLNTLNDNNWNSIEVKVDKGSKE